MSLHGGEVAEMTSEAKLAGEGRSALHQMRESIRE